MLTTVSVRSARRRSTVGAAIVDVREPAGVVGGVMGVNRSSAAAQDAVADLYSTCYSRIVGIVTLVAGTRVEAEECVQEAFVRLLGSWERVSRYDAPEVWVRTVALRQLSNRRRKARNGMRALLRQGPAPHEPPPATDRLDVMRALRQLSVPQRQVVVMHYLLGLSVDEIASALDIAPGTVKSRLSRARSALAPLLREETSHA